MAILRKSLLLSVLLPLVSCSGQGPELSLRTDNGQAPIGVVNTSETSAESADSGSTVIPGTDSPENTISANNADTTNNVDTTTTPNSENSTTNTNSTDTGSGPDQLQQTDENTNTVESVPEQTEDTDSAISEWLVIPRVDPASAPKIDAIAVDYIDGTTQLAGEWQSAVQTDSAGELLGINNFMFGDAEQLLDNNTHHWAALHDGVYFYLLVISDDAGLHQQDNNEDRKPWKDDTVELYFDGNHSRLTNYDGVDDFQFLINLQSSAGENNNTWRSNRRFFNTDVSAPTPSDFLFSTGLRKGPQSVDLGRGRKDIYEFRIKISELNIELGKPFGFEIQLNDDDDGGSRDAKWAWVHPVGLDLSNDFTWQNPSYMGSVVLQP